MQIRIFDSKIGQKVDFVPVVQGAVKMYGCGPTVYNRPHVGNLRTLLFYDLVYRFFGQVFPKVAFARNITDIDDKIIDAAEKEQLSPMDIAQKYTEVLHSVCAMLGMLPPTFEAKATDHVNSMIQIILILIERGHAYVAPDNNVYFSVSSFAEYGALSRKVIEHQIAGARVAVAGHKHNPEDFVLWKPDNRAGACWDSPWGRGRPGWHIECSAIAHDVLGKDFDIHAGGEDLKFPHHDNEIAQSCCAFPGSIFAKYWMHVAFVNMGDSKMSKSIGNVMYLEDVVEGGNISPAAVRYCLMSTHYRKPIDINIGAVQEAQKSLHKLQDAVSGRKIDLAHPCSPEVLHTLADDFNTHLALQCLHSLANATNKCVSTQEADALASELCASAALMGLNLTNASPRAVRQLDSAQEDQVMRWIQERNEARRHKDYGAADAIRLKLDAMGVGIVDAPDGTTSWHMKE